MLSKGRGQKLIHIPTEEFTQEQDKVIACQVITPSMTWVLYAGRRKLKLSYDDLIAYQGARGRRGSKLPRGYQKITRCDLEEK